MCVQQPSDELSEKLFQEVRMATETYRSSVEAQAQARAPLGRQAGFQSIELASLPVVAAIVCSATFEPCHATQYKHAFHKS